MTKYTEDFFQAVNGQWLADNPIPEDRSVWGNFIRMAEKSEEACIEIVQGASVESNHLLAIPYQAFMDTERIEAARFAPLQPYFDAIDAAASHDELARVIAQLQTEGLASLFTLFISADDNDPSRYTSHLYHGGLSLPERDYYLADSFAEIREQFRAHLEKMLQMADLGAEHAQAIIDFETEVARLHFTSVEARDTEKTNNPTTWDRVIADMTGFDLAGWLEVYGIDAQAHPHVTNMMPSFMTGVGPLWAETDLETLKIWAKWHTLSTLAPYLHDEVAEEAFDFFSRKLAGQPQQRARHKRAVTGFVSSIVGEELGREYVARHFPPSHKEEMDRLVANLLAAYGDSIKSLDWMSEETKERALAKLATFNPKIGFPNKWRDYSEMGLEPGDDLITVRAKSCAFEHADSLSRLAKPVDRDEWLMTPQTVNAYYYPVMNEIVFPAAILHPPFFDINATAAANYGAIGAVIGHEIGHGFDDQGSQYDADGRVNNWWTDADRAEFTARTKRLIEQYNAYSPAQLDDSHTVNGELTIGENIGDLGGLSIGIKAWRKALEQGVDNPGTIRDLLIAYAVLWRSQARKELAIQLLTVDPHSPPEFRCNGIVQHMDEFHEEFGTQPGDPMWRAPEDRIRIWN